MTAPTSEQQLRRALVDAVLGDATCADRAVDALRADPAALALAARCGVLGHLAARAGAAWPTAQARARLQHVRTLMLCHAAGGVLRSLDAGEIDVVAIKGIGTIALLGAAAPERTTSDIDIVVRARDVAPALRVLREAGFRDLDEPLERHVAQIASSVELHNFARTLRRGEIEVDLHWRFGPSPPYALDPNRLLARAVGASIAGCPVRVADPVDAVLIAVHHALRLSFAIESTLRDLADLRRWWEASDVPARAEELVERAVCSDLAPALLAMCGALVSRAPSHAVGALVRRLEGRLNAAERDEAQRLLRYLECTVANGVPARFTRAIFTPALCLRSVVARRPGSQEAHAPLTRRVMCLPSRIGRVARELAHLPQLRGYRAVARAQRRFH